MPKRRITTTSQSAVDLENYFRFADHLQEAIAKNTLDTDFVQRKLARGNGQITYFADSNVAISYLLGEEDRLKLSLNRLMDPSAARIGQDLTVKYILSGGLPGQNGDGLLMSTPHWNEALRHVQSAAQEVNATVAQQGKEAAQVLRAHLPELRDLADRPFALLERAKELDISDLLARIRQALRVRDRLTHAFRGDEPRIRCIEGMQLWNRVVDRTRTDDYRQWRKLITKHRKEIYGADAEEQPRNIDADAKTLALIETLYRETPEAIGPNATQRFLLISSDIATLRAASDRESTLEDEGIPNFVRELLVYNPLINFSAMHRQTVPNANVALRKGRDETEELRRVFFEVEKAIGALFPAGEVPRRPSEHWTRHWQLVDNVQRWSDAAEQIALVNSKLLTDEIRGNEAQEIAQIFSHDNIAAAAGGVIISKIHEIKEDHAVRMTQVAFDNLVDILKKPDSIKGEERAPTKIYEVDLLAGVRKKLPREFQPTTLRQLLAALSTDSTGVSGIIDAVSDSLRTGWESASGQLLASSIYLFLHSWESALACAVRSAELALHLRGDEGRLLRREAAYCSALSLRMLLRSEEDVQQAKALLEENIARFYSAKPLVAIRDKVERCTLLISACVDQAIHDVPQFRDQTGCNSFLVSGDLTIEFDEAVKDLDETLFTLLNNFAGIPGDQKLVSEIALQATANRLGAELLKNYLRSRVSGERPNLKPILRSSDDTLTLFGFVGLLPHPVARGYMAAAKYEMGELDRTTALSQLPATSDPSVLTAADKKEFQYIRWMIDRRRGADAQEDRAVA